MKDAQREIEAKFSLPSRELFPEIQAATMVGAFTAGPARTIDVTDHYLDTRGRHILAAGYACRLRETSKRTLDLKSLRPTTDAIKERDEYQVPLDPKRTVADYLRTARWPAGPVRVLVEEMIRDRRLAVLFVLRQTRQVRTLWDGERPVALLSLDVVRGIDPEPDHDLEIELLADGTPSELALLVEAVEQRWQLVPAVLSKFERELGRLERWDGAELERLKPAERVALARAAEFAPPLPAHVAYLLLLWDAGLTPRTMATILGMTRQRVLYWLQVFESRRTTLFARRPAAKAAEITPDQAMDEAGRRTLRLHFWRMLDHEPGTRLGVDIEELHDMRVATRRMRAALEVFEPYLPADAVNILKKGLRGLGRALGPVRDLDVFEHQARTYLATLPPPQAGDLDGLLDAWHDRRTAARQSMLAYLDRNDYARFVARFAAFFTSPTGDADQGFQAMPRVRDAAPQLITTRFHSVQTDGETALADGTIEALHALRIDCKKLRYALEFFAPALHPAARAVINEVRALQDHLGDLNDADVAVELLRTYLETTSGRPAGVLAYLDHCQDQRERLLHTFPAAWADFNRPAVTESLMTAVSDL